MENNTQKYCMRLKGLTRDPTRPADGPDPCPYLSVK